MPGSPLHVCPRGWQVMCCGISACPGVSQHARACCCMLWHVRACRSMSGCVIACYGVSGHVIACGGVCEYCVPRSPPCSAPSVGPAGRGGTSGAGGPRAAGGDWGGGGPRWSLCNARWLHMRVRGDTGTRTRWMPGSPLAMGDTGCLDAWDYPVPRSPPAMPGGAGQGWGLCAAASSRVPHRMAVLPPLWQRPSMGEGHSCAHPPLPQPRGDPGEWGGGGNPETFPLPPPPQSWDPLTAVAPLGQGHPGHPVTSGVPQSRGPLCHPRQCFRPWRCQRLRQRRGDSGGGGGASVGTGW